MTPYLEVCPLFSQWLMTRGANAKPRPIFFHTPLIRFAEVQLYIQASLVRATGDGFRAEHSDRDNLILDRGRG